MADLLSIAGNSVKTNQSALAIVGNNIANANTEGYVRQELDVRENLPTQAGTVVLGTGAIAVGVKRAYDSLLESSLRSSFSDLRSQAPVIDYTHQVIDLLGNEDASLTSALDQFFSSFRELGLDASSELRRNVVISESQGLASRLNELGSQLRSIDADTMEALEFRVTELNSLAEQLSIVNRKLSRQSRLESQPPDLLNTRDLVLQQISGLVGIKVSELTNGEVNVGLGDDANSLMLVNQSKSAQVGLNRQPGTLPIGVDLVLDPTGRTQSLSGITSGELSGYLSFRDTTLKNAIEQINSLAASITREVNGALAKGMDQYGESGSQLFEILPEMVVNTDFAKSNLFVSAQVSSVDSKNGHELELMFDQSNQRWLISDLTSGQTYSSGNSNNFSVNGIAISISGKPMDGDLVKVSTIEAQASNIRVVIDDAKKIAAGELLGITLGSGNTGGTKASVLTTSVSDLASKNTLQNLLVNNSHPSSAKTFQASHLSPSFFIGSGTADLALSSSRLSGTGGEIQVFTREGVHLFGSDTLNQSQLDAMLTADNGFEASAQYSDRYLNDSGAYLDKPWSLGMNGKSFIGTTEAGEQVLKIEAQIQGNSVPEVKNESGSTMTLIDAGALKLNGKALTALTLANGGSLSADSVVTWLNSNITTHSLDLTASAKTSVVLSGDDIDLTKTALTINGTTLSISSPLGSISEIANKINEASDTTGVRAVVDALQNITLENVVGGDAGKTASSTISFGKSEGLLKISGDITAAIKIVANRRSGDVSDKEVSIERTGISTVNDLEVLGLVETLSLGGVLDEDLILFTTGGSNDQLDLYASYESSERDFLHQRERTTDFIFTSSSSYQIVDRATKTVLSERTWSLGEPISYGVIALSIEGQPNVGDVFSVDGNRSGVASNENALRVADLEELGLASDGKSLKESYFSILTQAGNSARRAEVSREALDVVYQQSVQAKDSKVGVNLDEEAAELIRFQQAYQASAKVMQMANQLFDSILRI